MPFSVLTSEVCNTYGVDGIMIFSDLHLFKG